jgi:hypothetical protein
VVADGVTVVRVCRVERASSTRRPILYAGLVVRHPKLDELTAVVEDGALP